MKPPIVIPNSGSKPTANEMAQWNALLDIRVIAVAIMKAKVKTA